MTALALGGNSQRQNVIKKILEKTTEVYLVISENRDVIIPFEPELEGDEFICYITLKMKKKTTF